MSEMQRLLEGVRFGGEGEQDVREHPQVQEGLPCKVHVRDLPGGTHCKHVNPQVAVQGYRIRYLGMS